MVVKTYLGINNQAVLIYENTPIPSWSNSSDAVIIAAVQDADNGLISLSDYWAVGDERVVSLSAMSATDVGESHSAQDVILVLTHIGGKTLTTATTSGRTTCSFQVDMKHCLNEVGYMNSTNTNVGGWNSSNRRAWCNSVFKNAIPSSLSSIFKQHKNLTSAGNQSSTINTTDDWFALRSEVEVCGTTSHSYSGEGSQITYYQTSTNRIKKVNNNAYNYWLRSPSPSSNAWFGFVLSDASVGDIIASYTYGISVFGCI